MHRPCSVLELRGWKCNGSKVCCNVQNNQINQSKLLSMSVLGFELEWFDEVSGILQTLYLKFFLDDNTIELLKGTSTFLKRIFYPEVKLSDLFVGNSITV